MHTGCHISVTGNRRETSLIDADRVKEGGEDDPTTFSTLRHSDRIRERIHFTPHSRFN